MTEFAEIGRSGQTIEFINRGNGQFAQRLVNTSGTCVRILQVCASPDGTIIDTVGFTGLGQPMVYKQPSVVAAIFSDDQGFFGRSCPSCKSYFRTSGVSSKTNCPYCGYQDTLINFCTDNQKEFVRTFVKASMDAVASGKTTAINLDDLAQSLPSNSKSPWVYKEETQQTRFGCSSCKMETDILGEFGICPNCGLHNCEQIMEQKLTSLETKFAEAEQTIEDRHEREVEWERLLRCVSEFEGLANELKKFLLKNPMTDKRRADLNSLSFQRILNANDRMNDWFGFQILEGVNLDDRAFVNIMFNKRHLFTHNNGRVDQEYLDNTGDTKLRLNELVRFRSKEIKRLLPLIRQMSNNLTKGYLAVKTK